MAWSRSLRWLAFLIQAGRLVGVGRLSVEPGSDNRRAADQRVHRDRDCRQARKEAPDVPPVPLHDP